MDAYGGPNGIIRILATRTGRVTLIVSDPSYWKARALSVICEDTLKDALGRWMDDPAAPDDEGGPA